MKMVTFFKVKMLLHIIRCRSDLFLKQKLIQLKPKCMRFL